MFLNVCLFVEISMAIAINSHFPLKCFLAILAPSLAMAADADSSTAIEIHLHTLEGRVEPLKVSRSEITLEEIQEPILQLFGKNVPASIWVSLTMENETYTTPSCQPFLHVANGAAMNTIFAESETDDNVYVKFYSSDRQFEMTVRRSMALRDVQKKLCKAFQQRFPLMTASLVCAGNSFDNFNDMPFVTADDGDEIQVNFDQTSDMCANAICFAVESLRVVVVVVTS